MKKFYAIIPQLIALAMISGCSSLQVDVDVYKGPLINEESVQTEQMASMALESKSLIEVINVAISDEKAEETNLKQYLNQASRMIDDLLAFFEPTKETNIIRNKISLSKDTPKENLTQISKANKELIELNLRRELSWSVDRTRQDMAQALVNILDPDKLCKDEEHEKEFCKKATVGDTEQHTISAKKALIMLQNNILSDDLPIKTSLSEDAKNAFGALKQPLPEKVTIDEVVSAYRGDRSNDKARITMIFTLIDYAERTRTLGNLTGMFSPLLPDNFNYNSPEHGVSQSAALASRVRSGIQTLAPVLQAVGNSLLSQANELVRQKTLRNSQESRVVSEEALWKNTVLTAVRSGLLIDINTLPENQWHDLNIRDGLLNSLSDANKYAEGASILLQSAISDYRRAYAKNEIYKKARAKLNSNDCKAKESIGWKIGLQNCLNTNDISIVQLIISVIPTPPIDTQSFESTKAAILSAIDSHLEKLELMAANINIFDSWRVRLDDTLKLLPEHLKPQNGRDVMDGVLSALRQAQVNAVLAGQDTLADRIQNAYRIAESHRAGMIPLLPASTYLRNSHPATSIQPSSIQTTKYNLLWDSFLQGFPNLAPHKTSEEIVLSDQDKLFWERVNTVHLSGVGKTNQVLAKDDVGNWYVKSFSTEKEDIFQSMKKLALFNARGNIEAIHNIQNNHLADGKGLDIGTVTPRYLIHESQTFEEGSTSAVLKSVLYNYAKQVISIYQSILCAKDSQNAIDKIGNSIYKCESSKLTPRNLPGAASPAGLPNYSVSYKSIEATPDVLDFPLHRLEKDLVKTLMIPYSGGDPIDDNAKTLLSTYKSSYENALNELLFGIKLLAQSMSIFPAYDL